MSVTLVVLICYFLEIEKVVGYVLLKEMLNSFFSLRNDSFLKRIINWNSIVNNSQHYSYRNRILCLLGLIYAKAPLSENLANNNICSPDWRNSFGRSTEAAS